MYRFYKHNNEWRFIEKGKERGEPISTFALEGVLGVTGVRKVIAFCDQPTGETVEVTVENGFIIKAEVVEEYTDSVCDSEYNETFFERFERNERDEFYAEAM